MSIRSKDEEPRVSNNLESTIDKLSGLDVKEETSESIEAPSISNAIECKCGMPLCICEAPSLIPAPSPLVEPIRQVCISVFKLSCWESVCQYECSFVIYVFLYFELES